MTGTTPSGSRQRLRFLHHETLQPGQSITQTATWNGSRTTASPGTNPWGTFIVSSPNAPNGLTTTFSIEPLATSVTAQSTSYTLGQPVVLNWTATNQSSVPVTIPDTPGQFTVTNSSTAAQVFSASVAPTAPTVTIAPRQTFTQSVTWPDNSPAARWRVSASFQTLVPGWRNHVRHRVSVYHRPAGRNA